MRSERMQKVSLAASLLALALSISGVAYAAMITGEDVKNESLTGVDTRDGSLGKKELSFAPLTDASVQADQKTVNAEKVVSSDVAGFTTLATLKVNTTKNTDMLAVSSISASNTTAEMVPVRYRILLDDKVHHEQNFLGSIPADGSATDTISLLCNLIPAGEHTLKVQVEVMNNSVSFGTRTLNVVSMQDIH